MWAEAGVGGRGRGLSGGQEGTVSAGRYRRQWECRMQLRATNGVFVCCGGGGVRSHGKVDGAIATRVWPSAMAPVSPGRLVLWPLSCGPCRTHSDAL